MISSECARHIPVYVYISVKGSRYGLKPLIRVATRVRRGCHVKGKERKEEVVYICSRLWLSSDLQHIDNLVVSDQLVFPNK